MAFAKVTPYISLITSSHHPTLPLTSDDALAASAFALGLTFGFVRRTDVVLWADRRIGELEQPSAWLIDLSLSQEWYIADLISHLKQAAEAVKPVDICSAVYAIAPHAGGLSFDQAESLAKLLYRITRECLGGDWSYPLLAQTDEIADSFAFVRDGYSSLTTEQATEQLAEFIEKHRIESTTRALLPVVWQHQSNGETKDSRPALLPLVRVGVSAWIIQDGNYGDFSVGERTRFALEFHPIKPLQRSQDGLPLAERLKGSRYFVRARVAFLASNVWVIDAGSFMAYLEESPPQHVGVGNWLEGEIYLGIDPFFYFEDLHRQDGMPPLIYEWIVRSIQRETTPWIETKNAHGRSFFTRDETKESFVPTQSTKAWHDDGGSAHYLLSCEGVGRPTLP